MSGSRRAAALIAVAALALAVVVSLRPWSPAPARVSPSPSTTFFLQIARWDFISFTTGWVEVERRPGNTAVLYSTADGGRSWRQVRTPGPDNGPVFDFQILDSRHLLATTSSPEAVWWSSDGGQSWENRSPPALNQVGPAGRRRLGHVFLDLQHGWLLDAPSDSTPSDQPSILWATTDAALTWREVWRLDPRSPEFAGVLREGLHVALSFRDPKTGWLGIRTAQQGRLYRTDDAGGSWRLVSLPLSALLMNAVAHTPDGAALLITSNGYGSHATALTSRDGGDHWESPRPLPDALGGVPFRFAFVDHDHWLYGNGDDIFITNDAGQTWTSFRPSLPPGHRLGSELRFSDRLHGWADAGVVMLRSEDGGRSWKLAGPP